MNQILRMVYVIDDYDRYLAAHLKANEGLHVELDG